MAKWKKTPALVVVKGHKPQHGVVITKTGSKTRPAKRKRRRK